MIHALLLLPLALGAERVITAGAVRTELMGRTGVVGAANLGLYPELRVQPMLAADIASGGAHLGVGYSPILTADLRGITALHVGAITGAWRFTRRYRGALDIRATVGQFDTSLALAVGDLASAARIVPRTTIDYLQTSAAATADVELRPRLRLIGDVGYRVSGGLTDAARNVIPMSHGPQLNLGLTYTRSVRDSFGARLALQSEQFSIGRTTSIGRATISWHRKALREADLYATAGAAAVQSTDQTLNSTVAALPVGAAGVKVGRTDVNVTVDLLLSPVTNAMTGEAYQQAGGSFGGEWLPRADLVLRAKSGASWSVAGANAGDRTILAEASASYRSERNEVSFGLRASDFQLQSATTAHILELRAFLGLTLVGARVR